MLTRCGYYEGYVERADYVCKVPMGLVVTVLTGSLVTL
jgi:hypothetical protein